MKVEGNNLAIVGSDSTHSSPFSPQGSRPTLGSRSACEPPFTMRKEGGMDE